MMKNNIAFFIRSFLALFLVVHLWVWLRFMASFLQNDSWHYMEILVKSVSPLKHSLDVFAITLIPVLVMSFLINKRLVAKKRIVFYMLLGAFFSLAYLLITYQFRLVLIVPQAFYYIAAGGFSGLIYALIMIFPFKAHAQSSDISAVVHDRRKLLGILGLSIGSVSFFGALSGPFYLWSNREKFIDVKIDQLKDDELIITQVADKPVWIIKRSPDVIQLLEQDNEQLLDPQSEISDQPEQTRNNLRSIEPEYLVVYGLCTHLGCSPTYLPNGPTDHNSSQNPDPQFFCPCHGGVFDLAGRVYKNTPPPKNMVIPIHEFVSKEVVRLYHPSLEKQWNS